MISRDAPAFSCRVLEATGQWRTVARAGKLLRMAESARISSTPIRRIDQVIPPQISADGTHQWPFDPFCPVDVACFELGIPGNMRLNRHHYFEIGYCESGSAVLEVQEKTATLRTGDVMVIGPNLYHRTIHRPRDRASMTSLFFEPEILQRSSSYDDFGGYISSFVEQTSDFEHVIAANSDTARRVRDLITDIAGMLPAHSRRCQLTVQTHLKLITVLLMNHYSEHLGQQEAWHKRQQQLERLKPLFNYVEKNYTEQIRVSEVARYCAMSRSHFMAYFRTATGQSFVKYLNHFRVAKAQEKLVLSDHSIAEISQEIGFCDQSHFGVVFRDCVGMAPLAYRRKMQGRA